MAEMLFGVDVSEFQGVIDWDILNAVANFVIIRASFGTMRQDYQFGRNQLEARRVRRQAGPLGIAYYYYGYPTLLDPETSANYFLDNLGELEEGEQLALDLEGDIGPDPVGWSLRWLQRVETRTGVKASIYLNQNERTSHDWSPLASAGYPFWEAQYSGDRTTMPDPSPWPTMELRQWTNADQVHGIPALVDGDTFYGTFEDWEARGYHVPQVAAEPTDVPTPGVPVVPPVDPGKAGGILSDPPVLSEFEETYKPFEGGPKDVLLKVDTAAIDMTGDKAPIHLVASKPYGAGGPFKSSGTFMDQGRAYHRGTSGSWFGVPSDDVASDTAVSAGPKPTPPLLTWSMFLKDPLGVLIRLLFHRSV